MFNRLAPAADSEPQTTNAVCPVLTDEVVDPDIFVDYEGKRVLLCCQRCKVLFKAAPEKYLDMLPQFNGTHVPPLPASSGQFSGESDESSSLFGAFHPIVVHFPIALLLAAALAELLVILRGDTALARTARFCLLLGACGAVLAAAMGWVAASDFAKGAEAEQTLQIHRWLGVATAVLASAAAGCSFFLRKQSSESKPGVARLVYRSLLFGSAICTALAGHFGGILVYGAAHFGF